jgi:ATP-dependent Clp protease ATP-binding subunit ClpB
MKAHWQQEKQAIGRIRTLKEKIEKARFEADRATQTGDLGKAAELRYGTLPSSRRSWRPRTQSWPSCRRASACSRKRWTRKDVAEVVATWTGIPVSRMLESEVERLLHVEDRLRKRVVGQDEALLLVANAVRRARAGLATRGGPWARSCSWARPAWARPSWRGRWPSSFSTTRRRSSASTCPSTWRSTPWRA